MTRGHAALALAMTACVSGGHDRLDNASDASLAEAASTDAAELRDICDGSNELRFALRIVGSRSQLMPRMMSSIGFSYLYVLGNCRYWVNPGLYNHWQETRTGTLSQAQEQELSRLFDYAAWEDLAGYHLGSAAGLPAGELQAFDRENLIQCDNSCISYGTSLGESLDRFSEGFMQWSGDLWEIGAQPEPALRIVAKRVESAGPFMEHELELLIQWPFSWSIEELLADYEGPGLLLNDETRVRELRGLRSMYVGKGPFLDGKRNPFRDSFAFLVGNDSTVYYQLWFRDAVPLETADGLIPFPTAIPAP